MITNLGGEIDLDPARYGFKAAGLQRAQRSGEKVPRGFALDADSAQRVAAGDASALSALGEACASLFDGAPAGCTLAVRSSPNRSLPGALLTQLGVALDRRAVEEAIRAVVHSTERPQVHEQLAARRQHEPREAWLGVIVQEQVRVASARDFGAVAFTHDPNSGERGLRGEYAAGGTLDVVSGRTRPLPFRAAGFEGRDLVKENPEGWSAIEALVARLARSFDEPLELELCFAAGTLWLLQVRALTLGVRGLVRVALEAIEDDSPQYARWLAELARRGLGGLVEQHFSEGPLGAATALMRGVAASPGAASGVVVTDVARAIERARSEPVVLVRPDAIPDDIAAFRVAKAVVTSSGGLTCHAAVIARGLAVPAVVGVSGMGAGKLRIEAGPGLVWGGRDAREKLLEEGDWVSVDARRGLVYRGALPVEPQLRDSELRQLFMQVRKLRPTPLWVLGPPELALRLKDDICLDGALCSWPEHGPLPEGRGRECWIQIDVAQIEARLPELPRGWGVVLTGDLGAVSLPALREAAPLRAFGARLEGSTALPPGAALDLLVLNESDPSSLARGTARFDSGASSENSTKAARLLHVVNFPERAPVPLGNNVGWVCPASHVALTALRYAAARRDRSVISLADWE